MPQDRFFLKKISNDVETELVGEIIAGHLEECGLRLQTGGAGAGPSRKHAKLSVIDGTVWVDDLHSTNGTFVNGKRITARTQLRSNDLVRFDMEDFKFRTEAPEIVENQTVQRAPGSQDAVANGSADEQQYPFVKPRQGKNPTIRIDPKQLKLNPNPQEVAPAVADLDVPYLIVSAGIRVGARIELRTAGSAKREWRIGCDPDREIVFVDKGVSAIHAKIVNEGKSWKVVDQLASNGTFVNGKPTNLSYLRSGDRLQFGPVECVFHLPATPSIAERISGSTARVTILALVSFLATIVIILLAIYLLK